MKYLLQSALDAGFLRARRAGLTGLFLMAGWSPVMLQAELERVPQRTFSAQGNLVNGDTVRHDLAYMNIARGHVWQFVNDLAQNHSIDALIVNVEKAQANIAGTLETLGYENAHFFLVDPHGIYLAESGEIQHAGVAMTLAVTEPLAGKDEWLVGSGQPSANLLIQGGLTMGDERNADQGPMLNLVGQQVALDGAKINWESNGSRLVILALGPQVAPLIIEQATHLAVDDGVNPFNGELTVVDSRLGRAEGVREVTMAGGNITLGDSSVVLQAREGDAAKATLIGTAGVEMNAAATIQALAPDSTIEIRSPAGDILLTDEETAISAAQSVDSLLIMLAGQQITLSEKASIQLDGGSQNSRRASRLEMTSAGSIELRSGANIQATSRDSGEAPQVILNARDDVSVGGGAYLNMTTSGAGKGGGALSLISQQGDVVLGRRSTVEASNPVIHSSSNSSGDGGDILLSAPRGQVQLNPGAVVASSIEGGNQSAGEGGDITLEARQVVLSPAAGVFASAVGPDSSETQKAKAGSVAIKAEEIELRGSTVSVSSVNSLSGNVSAQASAVLRMNDGARIVNSAEGNQVTGGDININTELNGRGQSLFLLNNGSILTNAHAEEAGDGGNININETSGRNLVVLGGNAFIDTSARRAASADALTLSRILPTAKTAVAESKGSGGGLTIRALEVYQMEGADIRTQGISEEVNGDVNFETPGVEATSALTALPETYMDVSRITSSRCMARHDRDVSSLVLEQQRMPSDPAQPYQGVTPQQLVVFLQQRQAVDGRSQPVLRITPAHEINCKRQ